MSCFNRGTLRGHSRLWQMFYTALEQIVQDWASFVRTYLLGFGKNCSGNFYKEFLRYQTTCSLKNLLWIKNALNGIVIAKLIQASNDIISGNGEIPTKYTKIIWLYSGDQNYGPIFKWLKPVQLLNGSVFRSPSEYQTIFIKDKIS